MKLYEVKKPKTLNDYQLELAEIEDETKFIKQRMEYMSIKFDTIYGHEYKQYIKNLFHQRFSVAVIDHPDQFTELVISPQLTITMYKLYPEEKKKEIVDLYLELEKMDDTLDRLKKRWFSIHRKIDKNFKM